MRTIVKTKLLGDKLELRDYELNKSDLKVILCSSKNYKQCFHIREPFMTLTLNAQSKGKIVNTQRSKFYPYNYYKMVSFLWKPTKTVEQSQIQDKQEIYNEETRSVRFVPISTFNN